MPLPTILPRPPLLALLLLILLAGCCHARIVGFYNTRPMRDRQGHIMDAHDGSVQRFHGRGPFYMHTVSYGLCEVGSRSGDQVDVFDRPLSPST